MGGTYAVAAQAGTPLGVLARGVDGQGTSGKASVGCGLRALEMCMQGMPQEVFRYRCINV